MNKWMDSWKDGWLVARVGGWLAKMSTMCYTPIWKMADGPGDQDFLGTNLSENKASQ